MTGTVEALSTFVKINRLVWGVITAKITFGILLCCLPMRFLIFSLVFLRSQWCSPKRRCCFVVSVFDFSNLDAIIRVRMLLCETSMLLFVSVCCYAKPRCYYSCPYAVMRNLDAIIHVSNYVRLNRLSLKRGTGNRGMGMGNGESLKWGIFKSGNL